MIYSSVDPTTNPFNDFLANYGIWIAVALAGTIFIVVLIFFIIAQVKRKKEEPGVSNKKPVDPHIYDRAQAILTAVGGEANILEHSLNGSRITLTLADSDSIDEEALKSNGAIMIKMTKKITLAIESDPDKIYKEMFRL